MLKELKEAKRGYNESYSKSDRKRLLQRSSAGMVKPEIVKRVPAISKTILDVGCGYGVLADFLLKAGKLREYVGLDISSERLKVARARLNGLPAGLILGVSEFLPFRESSFDVVVCCGVLQHVVDQRKAVNEMSKTTKFGGLLIITTGRKDWVKIWRKFPLSYPLRALDGAKARKRGAISAPRGVRNVFPSEKELTHLATDSGLKILEHQRITFRVPFHLRIPYLPYEISGFKRLNKMDSLQGSRHVQLLAATK